MSQKANPTLIGTFTLLGLLLAAAALVILGAGRFFDARHEILLFFDKSANGLQIGSEVRFGGVRIGQVSAIRVLIDPKENRKIIPVVVEVSEREMRFISSDNGGGLDLATKEGVENAVKAGLRARMKQQSLLTGQLYVEFDMLPDTEGFVFHSGRERRLPVVPTTATEIDELIAGISDGLKRFNDLDLAGIIGELRDVLTNTKEQISELDMKRINDNVVGISEDIKRITGDEKLQRAVESLDAALIQIRDMATKVNEGFDPLAEDFKKLAADTSASLEKIERATDEISNSANPRAPTLMKLQQLLNETERMSRAVQELSTDLKRHPNSILSGRAAE